MNAVWCLVDVRFNSTYYLDRIWSNYESDMKLRVIRIRVLWEWIQWIQRIQSRSLTYPKNRGGNVLATSCHTVGAIRQSETWGHAFSDTAQLSVSFKRSRVVLTPGTCRQHWGQSRHRNYRMTDPSPQYKRSASNFNQSPHIIAYYMV